MATATVPATPATAGETRPTLTRRQTILLVGSIMLGTALAALDVTIVGTALPTIVGTLGGVDLYSWVITVYLLTSTTTVPLYGRLADIYGRKPLYLFGIAIFLVGSLLCGIAQSMEQLILFRAIQGLGAGAIIPMGMTILGDTFSVEQRARVQAFIVMVWGTSSVVGPAAGALIVSYLPWGWVFLVNLPFGAAALWMIQANYHERMERRRRAIDWLGAVLLTAAVTFLLLAMQQAGSPGGVGAGPLAMLVAAIASGVAFILVEARVADPVVPLALFRVPLIAVGYLANFLSGTVQLGISSYVPLYVQGAMGGTAQSVGLTITPMLLAWPIGAIVSSKLIVPFGYRRVLIAGMLSTAVGALSLLFVTRQAPLGLVMFSVGAVGLGMGLTVSPTVIALQNAVGWSQRGSVTALTTFFRTIGGSIGVALMGAIINFELATRLGAAAMAAAPATAGRRGGDVVSAILDPASRAGVPAELAARVQDALASALWDTYLIPAVCAVAGLALVLIYFPVGSVQQLAAEGTAEARGTNHRS